MLYTYSTEQLPCRIREKQYVQLETKDTQAMNKFINKLQDLKGVMQSNLTDFRKKVDF